MFVLALRENYKFLSSYLKDPCPISSTWMVGVTSVTPLVMCELFGTRRDMRLSNICLLEEK